MLGEKLRPSGEDGSLPWELLAQCDAVYFTGGDVAALRAARRAQGARRRRRASCRRSGRPVCRSTFSSGAGRTRASASSRASSIPRRASSSRPPARSAAGSVPAARSGPRRSPGPVADAYGCGDCFAAGVTFGLGRSLPVDEAVAIGARCGATVLTSKGPYERQFTGDEL